MGRQLAIGDIHGCRVALETLVGFVGVGSSDTVITLGDLVDRGRDSRGVIDLLLGLEDRFSCHLVHLRGNHEVMMLRAREERVALTEWIRVGGGATLDSYAATTFDDIPRSHWDFLERSAAYYETPGHFFVHANASPNLALKDQPEFMLLWEFFDNPPPHQSGKTMVCGHTPQPSGRPRDLGHAVCIDTNAHGGGWLTCLDAESGQFWQANEAGEKRTDFRGEP